MNSTKKKTKRVLMSHLKVDRNTMTRSEKGPDC